MAYAIVGFGAAAYSPAKYGILTELLPPEKLVAANGWIEGLTVGSIILGTVFGGMLISNQLSTFLLGFDIPFFDTGVDTAPESAICIIALVYIIAAAFNLRIPDTGAVYPKQESNPIRLIKDFEHCFRTLWQDRLGQISLAVTTLFWGAGATLQFIVLKWAESALGMTLSQGAILQAVVAFGVAGGAVWAGSSAGTVAGLACGASDGQSLPAMVACLRPRIPCHVARSGVVVRLVGVSDPLFVGILCGSR